MAEGVLLPVGEGIEAISQSIVWSPTGRFYLQVVEGDGPEVIVSRVGHAGPSVTIRPNPGDHLRPSFGARFVVRDNILITWGCGTECSESMLYDSTGRRLASFAHHFISPDGRLALTYPAWPHVESPTIHVMDLANGQIQHTEAFHRLPRLCAASWEDGGALLSSCRGQQRVAIDIASR